MKELSREEFSSFIVHQNSKEHIARVADYIGDDIDRYTWLIDIVCENTPKYSQKAAWVMEHCAVRFPALVDCHIDRLLDVLKQEVHPGVKRAILHALESRPMNEDQSGIALEYAFACLEDADEKVAAKVYAMGLILNLSMPYPELRRELKLHIESQLPYQSPAFKSKAARILAALKSK